MGEESLRNTVGELRGVSLLVDAEGELACFVLNSCTGVRLLGA